MGDDGYDQKGPDGRLQGRGDLETPFMAVAPGFAPQPQPLAVGNATGVTTYRCVHATIVRETADLESPKGGVLPEGTDIVAIEHKVLANGTVRVLINVDFGKYAGWVSTVASDGSVILQPTSPAALAFAAANEAVDASLETTSVEPADAPSEQVRVTLQLLPTQHRFSLTPGYRSQEIINQSQYCCACSQPQLPPQADAIAAILATTMLQKYAASLHKEGYAGVGDLADADDDDLTALGFKKPEIKRLRKALAALEPGPGAE